MKIALFGFYFGKFPVHMPLWFRICGTNPDIDWILITDRHVGYPVPDNVTVIETDIKSLTQFFSERLGLKANLYRPYKLCDFRPAYGYIYEEMLKGYDFWGYVDFDLVFGDIRAFFTGEILAKYDKIQPFGQLSLYRNCEKINTLFMKSCEGVADYRDVFTEGTHYAFDEFRGIDKICEVEGIERYRSSDIYVETYIFRSKFVDKNSGREDAVYFWEDGKLYMAFQQDGGIVQKEIMYIHLRNRKMRMPRFVLSADSFFVVPNTFKRKQKGVLTLRDIETRNRPIPLTYGPVQWKFDKRIKKPIQRFFRGLKEKKK